MDHFVYQDGVLCAEDVSVAEIAAQVGTPFYLYSSATLLRHYRLFDEALAGMDHLVCFAMKSLSNQAILQLLGEAGAGMDVVSGGEYARARAAGVPGERIVFSGVGKTRVEMRQALEGGIRQFNVESEPEMEALSAVAVELGKIAPITIRVNPDVDAKTHPYISTGLKQNKFGVEFAAAEGLYAEAARLPGIRIEGIASHIGSQLLELQPFLDALDRVLALVDRLSAQGIRLHHIDVGGGLGVRYRDEVPPTPAAWAAAVTGKLLGRGLALHTEPGRSIAANAGVLITRVEVLKTSEVKRFAVVDAAMNDLLRPALYNAWMDIVRVTADSGEAEHTYDIVGPVCETGDWLGRDRQLALAEGDLLAIRSAGAYGFTMASNYNSRGRAAEVMVDGDRLHIVRERETFDDLIRGEHTLP